MCGHLHTGSILAIYKENQYMVKFMKPELPTQKILDINMSTEFTESNNTNPNNFKPPGNFNYSSQGNGLNLFGNNMNSKNSLASGFANKERNGGNYSNNGVNNENIYSDIVDNVNFDITAFLIKLLTLKSNLVDVLKKANDRRKS